jgi:hypothetical protein
MSNLMEEMMVKLNNKFNFKTGRYCFFVRQFFMSPIGWSKRRRMVDGRKCIENNWRYKLIASKKALIKLKILLNPI